MVIGLGITVSVNITRYSRKFEEFIQLSREYYVKFYIKPKPKIVPVIKEEKSKTKEEIIKVIKPTKYITNPG